MRLRNSPILALVFVLLTGCAGVQIHDNLKAPAGTIEGNQFTGIRYPFRVTAPPPWKMTTEFPEFLEELGYEGPGPFDPEVTELYLFNPSTESNVQIDFTPASRGARFSQKAIEGLTTAATESLKSELDEEHGQGAVDITVGPTEPVSLKGVQFAAKKYVTYSMRGVKREQGWIYGYAEPDQIFILYMILEKEGSKDRENMKKILDSFEVLQIK
jgi:hypothetical protein